MRLIKSRLKIIRRLGILPGLSRKLPKNRLKSPGQHGRMLTFKSKRSSLSDDYKERLLEKQKLRFNYGVTEKQLRKYYAKSKKSEGSTGLKLLQFLESRLDCLIYRLGFAPTIPAARQLVKHGHILVNNIATSSPSFNCTKFDILSLKKDSRITNLIKENVEREEEKRKLIQKRGKQINFKTWHLKTLLPKHLTLNSNNLIGQVVKAVRRSDVLVKVKDLKVVEFYSR